EAIAQSLVPLDLAYEWNQALMDLGATLCRPRQPLCLVCPLVSQCGGPRAAIARKPQGEFSGSNRYYRGRILDALRQSDGVPLEELVASHGGRRDLIDRLTVDGLIEIENGLAHLPA
ncbi:MAG: A/G-specific adenine glycosylase, partial [Chloroflexi bacterium]|nr:A/G-specific adenine glycosylase [Chloroflexota bacterium]